MIDLLRLRYHVMLAGDTAARLLLFYLEMQRPGEPLEDADAMLIAGGMAFPCCAHACRSTVDGIIPSLVGIVTHSLSASVWEHLSRGPQILALTLGGQRWPVRMVGNPGGLYEGCFLSTGLPTTEPEPLRFAHQMSAGESE